MVKLGSFRGAAHRLNTTQPAISQRIAGSSANGVRLLHRDQRRCRDPQRAAMMIHAEKLSGYAPRCWRRSVTARRRGVPRLGVAETIVHLGAAAVQTLIEVYPDQSRRSRSTSVELANGCSARNEPPPLGPMQLRQQLCTATMRSALTRARRGRVVNVTGARSGEISDYHLLRKTC